LSTKPEQSRLALSEGESKDGPTIESALVRDRYPATELPRSPSESAKPAQGADGSGAA
jgi:hypothetical protein